METLPYEIINHISTFFTNSDHGNFIIATRNIHTACRDETKKKYATKKGVVHFCKHGDLEMVQYCHRIHLEFTKDAMDLAAENGHLEIVKWLHENRTEGCTTNAMNSAARNGHLEMVQWLHAMHTENRNEGCTVDTMNLAAMNGHLEIVKWLHKHRNEGCTTGAMDWAAMNGHFEIVKWLHAMH